MLKYEVYKITLLCISWFKYKALTRKTFWAFQSQTFTKVVFIQFLKKNSKTNGDFILNW